jgi:hypothetical protein
MEAPDKKVRSAVRIATFCPCLLLLLAPISALAETTPAPSEREAATAELSRLIHDAVAAKLPRVHEIDGGWGHTAPLPERLRAPRLRRTVVQVGDKMEAPDGPWRKFRLRVDDPDRDLKVRVLGLKRIDATTYRLSVRTDVALAAEADVQRWRNGVKLADLTAKADVSLRVLLECDLSAKLDPKKLGAVALQPEVTKLTLDLKDFTPRRVTFHRAGVDVEGPALEGLGDELREPLQELLRSAEPEAKKRAGEALAKALKEPKGPITPAALLKVVGPLLKDEPKP